MERMSVGSLGPAWCCINRCVPRLSASGCKCGDNLFHRIGNRKLMFKPIGFMGLLSKVSFARSVATRVVTATRLATV
jgi:hypothetical protein